MSNYRYTLEKYNGMKTKHTCPNCGKAKVFTRYIDTHTNAYVADHLGRCDREVKCGYHVRPEYEKQKEKIIKQKFIPAKKSLPTVNCKLSTVNCHLSTANCEPSTVNCQLSTEHSRLTTHDLRLTLTDYENNYLVQLLCVVFGRQLAMQVVGQYLVGTHHHWLGSTVFWQVDEQGMIHAGKVMLYTEGGRRVKQPFNHVTWMHTIMGLKDFSLNQCLFGQHLLRGNKKIVALVESEKTALIGAAYMPQFLWLATGGMGNLTAEKLQPLRNHRVYMLPDMGAEDKWKAIAATMPNCVVSSMLPQMATSTEYAQGLDVADYLLWKIRHLTG